ncbi:MAG: hypothetical protein WC829_15685 [Hyphomicrobium sp.]|jgi:hypothetical protein
MTTTHVSMCLCVRGAIRNLQAQRSKKTGFLHDDGRPMNKGEAINALMDELVKGHETIPMNPLCGNPCQNSPLCKGFDFGERGGCPGYEADATPTP